MKVFFALCLGLLGVTAEAADLPFLGGAAQLQVAWAAGPALSPTESLLRVSWLRGSDRAAMEAPGKFKVELYMPMMGHGSSPTQIDRVLDSRGQPLLGQYEVTGLYFTMAGPWEVRVSLQTPDGKTEMEKFPVRL